MPGRLPTATGPLPLKLLRYTISGRAFSQRMLAWRRRNQ
jgi:hypothetical protein